MGFKNLNSGITEDGHSVDIQRSLIFDGCLAGKQIAIPFKINLVTKQVTKQARMPTEDGHIYGAINIYADLQ